MLNLHQAMKTRSPNKRTTAMTLVEVLVVIAVLAILAALFLPALAKAKCRPSRINCISQIKQIGIAYRLWEGDNMLGDNNLLVDGKSVQSGIFSLQPHQTIAWSMDRHHGVGNIGMADDSAAQVTSEGFQQANRVVLGTNSITGRWLIP
jgi:prepilin-type N-terminal cleavage/methylation domain-containing protein